jgi:hypothetical protein
MIRTLRIIRTKVSFIPAPCFSIMQTSSESNKRPSSTTTRAVSSTTTKTYSPNDLPVYDYDLVVVGGGSGGKKREQVLE